MKDFMIDLAENMVEYGKDITGNKRRPVNPMRPTGGVVGNHLPIQTDNRNRYISYTKNKKDAHLHQM